MEPCNTERSRFKVTVSDPEGHFSCLNISYTSKNLAHIS